MKKIAMIVLLALTACTREDSSRRTLEGAGFKSIEFTGYRFTGCSDSDAFHTGFKATGPSGGKVEGVVCCGWLKSCTIRFD
jgi:hypothetical protein